MALKIEQAESQFAQKLTNPLRQILSDLQYSIPAQYRLKISLLDANGRKKRSTASAENWSPDSGRIEISFEAGYQQMHADQIQGSDLSRQMRTRRNPSGDPPERHREPAGSDPLALLVKALDRAESRPGWSFVPLRKFRDEILVAENIPSMRTDIERQNVLRSAIDKKLVLVGRVPNPKTPEFPVTTVRLNRLMPEVQRFIGHGHAADLDFHPLQIPGEPLSATVLRERR
jgi:hypothetical protein